MFLRRVIAALKKIGKGGTWHPMDQVDIERFEPPLDRSLEPGTSYFCMDQFDAKLKARLFQIPVQFQSIVDNERLRNTIGQVVVLRVEEVLYMALFEDTVHQAFHDQTVGWRFKADDNGHGIASILIPYGRDDRATNRQPIKGIDDEEIKSGEVEFPTLIGTRGPGPLLWRIVRRPAVRV